MTPAEMRAAAERLDREVFTQVPLTPEQFDASNLAYRALTRLADVIEYASLGLLATSGERGSEGIAETHRQVLRIARGEDT